MLILTIKTDQPEAEIGLYDDTNQLAHETWHAHRQLSETIHTKIKTMLKSQQKDWQSLEGIVAFKGPGSFTGLRIGLTVANSLSANLHIPVVSGSGADWIEVAIKKLLDGKNETIALPDYGREAHITTPRK